MLDYAARPGAFSSASHSIHLKTSPLSAAALAAAAASGFAMIAAAFDLREPDGQSRLLDNLRREPLLAHIWSEDIIAQYRAMMREWRTDPAIAEETTMELLAQLRKHRETADAVVRLCLRPVAAHAAVSLAQVRAIANLQLAAGVNRSR